MVKDDPVAMKLATNMDKNKAESQRLSRKTQKLSLEEGKDLALHTIQIELIGVQQPVVCQGPN